MNATRSLGEELSLALQHHQAGRLGEAEALYAAILARQADHGDALHLLGLCRFQGGDLQEGLRLIGKAVEGRPDSPTFRMNLGTLQEAAGRWEEAETSFRKALELRPGYAEARFNLGNLLRKQERPLEAKAAFEAVLEGQPNHVGAHCNLGRLLREEGGLEEAMAHYRRALEGDPSLVEAHGNLSLALEAAGRGPEAIDSALAALDLRPEAPGFARLAVLLEGEGRREEAAEALSASLGLDSENPVVWGNLGRLLHLRGEFDDAIVCHLESLKRDPGLPDVENNLGSSLLAQGRGELAVEAFRRALALHPDFPEAHFNLGTAYQGLGRLPEARAELERALALKPAYPGALVNLGNVFVELKENTAATACFERALALDPAMPEAHNNLGSRLMDLGQVDRAEAAYLESLRLDPAYATAWFNLGIARERLGRGEEAQEAYRRAIAEDPAYAKPHLNLGTMLLSEGDVAGARSAFDRAAELDPRDRDAQDNALFTRLYDPRESPASIWAAHRAWNEARERPAVPAAVLGPLEGRRLRIGYVSPDFFQHSCAYFAEPLFRAHDREGFEVFAYANVNSPDATTERIKGLVDGWRDIRGMGSAEAAGLVRRDGVDVLVDLAGHTAHNRLDLFAHRPAPVQATWLGYPHSTGMEEIRWRICDGLTDPPGLSEPYCSESLLRLPGCFLCYGPPPDAPEVGPLPCETGAPFTFGSFNHLPKLTDHVLETWARILRSAPRSRLLLKARSFQTPRVREGYAAKFEALGVPRERLELLAWVPAKEHHLALYNRVDLGLDPFPFNGATTTCEALWMGVPVVCLAGDRHAGRVGLSLLSTLGLRAFVAEDEEAYVRIALAGAASPGELARQRASLRRRMAASPLCDAAGFARRMETAYREMLATVG